MNKKRLEEISKGEMNRRIRLVKERLKRAAEYDQKRGIEINNVFPGIWQEIETLKRMDRKEKIN